MANTATNIYTVSERPTLCKRVDAYRISYDTVDTDLLIHTPDTDKSVYVKSINFSEANATTPTWKQRSPALTGTVATTNTDATITGTGTAFLTEYAGGDEIVITDGNTLTILSIADDESMEATANATSSVSGKAHKKQQVISKPELYDYQANGSMVDPDAWVFATKKAYALVLSATVAISNVLLHVQEGKPD